MDTRTDLITDLFRTVGRFRRTLRRSAGSPFAAPGLTESQAELLRLIGRQPGISTQGLSVDRYLGRGPALAARPVAGSAA